MSFVANCPDGTWFFKKFNTSCAATEHAGLATYCIQTDIWQCNQIVFSEESSGFEWLHA